MAALQIDILNSRDKKVLLQISGLVATSTISDVKRRYVEQSKKKFDINRLAFRAEPTGKLLKDSDTLQALDVHRSKTLYFKDLGPQIGWTTVFLTEYAGPLIIYLIFYMRPAVIYGDTSKVSRHLAVNLACGAWTFHYAKRLLETVFVHRFSHATMPITNIIKNSAYYWGFTALVAYFNNHPLYTSATDLQIYGGLAGFIFCELGNLSIHVALRNLRPAGSKQRRIPYPTGNPFTKLFNLVSCPNYTYEVGAWLSYTIMSQSLACALFTFAGFYQMLVWAQGKHRNYIKEFTNYPKSRKAMVPFVI